MFSPQAGVACNRATQVCSNVGGTSVDLTQLYFGRQAAVNLANSITLLLLSRSWHPKRLLLRQRQQLRPKHRGRRGRMCQ